MKIIKWVVGGIRMSYEDFRYHTPWRAVFLTWIGGIIVSALTGIGVETTFDWFAGLVVLFAMITLIWVTFLYFKNKNREE